ncbi:MAG: cyanophycin synthetase, partial [Bacteroidia bacterium]|nr:cyanophycin synthetase [Bacteroidia bacterium]
MTAFVGIFMHSDAAPSVPRINARPTDAFDIFNLKHYAGPNPYLNTAALVFDLVLLEDRRPLPVAHYLPAIGFYYPHLLEETYLSHAHLFSRVVAEVNNLEMDLHLDNWILKNGEGFTRIAVQSLHGRTTREVIYTVWDWFEAMTAHEEFGLDQQLQLLQQTFRKSVYGGPTVYALWQAAQKRGIPTMFLWEEELVQYGYGRRQVRGAGTTFDRDSRLDSDFTTRKDDCKAFLGTLGFPVPRGHVVTRLSEALEVAELIGYPVVVKPVAGHKGIGVTAHILSPAELEFACDKAVDAIPLDQPVRLIVESHIIGTDFRLLCVEGRFVAAVERHPPSVTGDGLSTIQQLVAKENASPARSDTPTSPLGKIQLDDAMSTYLAEQNLTMESIPAPGYRVYLRKVANLSAGGVSYDATRTIHPDNIILAQDIAQHFRLTCLGIDVMTTTLAKSWKDGNFGIIEI